MIEIFKDEAGEWRYRVKGRNGEIMATSEGYGRKADARRGLNDLRALLREPMNPVVLA
jgi:uncharacterized protein YegP (UPF0339 family)